MAVTILIPTPLRQYAGNQRAVEVDGATVEEALADFARKHDGIRKHLFDDKGALRSFINVYVNDDDIRHLQNTDTALRGGETISIIPSVAGGR
jgi:molybdopterin converting factor small subunit